MTAKKLVITADDFGLAAEIDRGIREACEKKIVTHVSLVANGANFEEAAKYLAQNPGVSAGIHLNLTDGRPLTNSNDLKSFVNSERRFKGSHGQAGWTFFMRPSLLKSVEEEWKAQIEKVLSRNISLFQVNCHGHLHAIPGLFQLVFKMAEEYHIPFVRVVDEKLSASCFFSSPVRAFKTLFLTLGFRLGQYRVARTSSVKTYPCVGVFDSGCLTQDRLSRILDQLPEGFLELICHPGEGSENLGREFPWGYHWDEERRLMSSEKVSEDLKSRGIQLINFRDVKERLFRS